MFRRVDPGPDGHDYEVVAIPGARAVKTYRCPGCDHEIRCGVPHVAVWRVDDEAGAEPRHWDTPCGAQRAHPGPNRP
ncbi:MAG: hypothetical protein KIH64_017050, partial [Mycobacterium sp.]|nr:hypothetical protein [Mycobacterium sp.]